MSISVQINHGISVQIKPQGKKKLADTSTYDIYLHFTISQNGITQCTPAISTGISVLVSDWSNNQMKGRGERPQLVNNSLTEKVQTAKTHLENIRSKVKTCTQVKTEVVTAIKTALTGKAPRGKKNELTALLKDYTVDAVMQHLFSIQKQSKERQRIYVRALTFLHSYFKNNTPIITNITETDLQGFQVWFVDNCRVTRGKQKGQPYAQDSVTTWFTMIAAVFTHAYKRMKILPVNPLPEKFRGSFADVEKPVLSEQECMRIINLPDAALSYTEQVAKYCLLVQLLTGMGFGDLRSLTRDHLKFDTNAQQWHLKKERNKNGTIFNVYLTSRAKYSFDKLRELAGGTDTIFELPGIDYTNRIYSQLTTKAGVQTHVTSYTLRHSFAVDYMNNDGRLEDLGKMIGNDIRNTRIYGRISNKRLAQKANQLEQKSAMHQL